jgi:hypothetical protein
MIRAMVSLIHRFFLGGVAFGEDVFLVMVGPLSQENDHCSETFLFCNSSFIF